MMRRLVAANIVLGEPLDFAIYDERGNLLLRKGFVVTMPDQVERLLLRKALVAGPDEEIELQRRPVSVALPASPRPVAELEPVFDAVNGLVLNLKHALGTSLASPDQIDLPERIGKLADTVQAFCQRDIDAVLAAPGLDFRNPYIIVHQVMGAVLTELVAARKGISTEQRRSLVCAALTRDFGQLPMQAELEKLTTPLSELQREQLNAHPERGVKMLERAGVDDPIWLEAVRFHHERLDGSGYPRQLNGDAIPIGARVLAVCDAYSAMSKPRAYRVKAYNPQQALRELFLSAGVLMDGELTQLLIREIGMLPPGTIVRLKCGEIAVVKSPTQLAAAARVYSVYGKSGAVLGAPVLRDASLPDFEITGMVPYSECRSAAVTIKRVWL